MNYKKPFKYITILILSVALPALFINFSQNRYVHADPTTIYVNSETGNDTTGTGEVGSPYKTFHKAYTVSISGDTINLTGTFDWTDADETGDAQYSGYTLTKNLTIVGQRADQTIVQAADTPHTTDRRIFTISSGYTVTLQGLTIRHGNNTSDNHASAILSSGNVTILQCHITENSNTARFGGAPLAVGGRLIARNTTFSYNNYDDYWDGYTGAISISSTDPANEVTNCTFYENRGGYNGAIYASGAVLTVTNSTFVNNHSGCSSAAIYSRNSGHVYVKNSLFANNGYDPDLVADVGGVFTDGGYNIIESTEGTSVFVNGENGNIVGEQTEENLDTDIALNNSLYGVPTLSIGTGSIAINAGDESDHNGFSIPTEDARGASRPDTVDIGAFEYGGLLTIEEPTTQSSGISFSSVSYNKATLSLTKGNGSRRMIFAKEASSGTAVPVDGTAYVANSTFGSGSQIGTTGWYAVYSGTGNSVTVTGLLSDRDYIFQSFEYNGTLAGTQNYLTTATSANTGVQKTDPVQAPSIQAKDIVFSNVGKDRMDVSWTSGNGTGRTVFVKKSSVSNANPVDGTTYSANASFGSGDQIGSTGWYAVYSGTGSSVTVTGLERASVYSVQVVEYNGDTGDEHYLTSTGSNNPKYQDTPYGSSFDGFETGDFSNFSWSFSGNADWTIVSDIVYEDSYAAKAGTVSHNQSSSLLLTTTIDEAGDITFYKKVSSEGCCDGLSFYIDSVLQSGGTWKGTLDWCVSTYAVTEGEHTFEWKYFKDGSVNTGSDTAWLDSITFPGSTEDVYTLSYAAGAGGSISGEVYQAVISGNDGSSITATPSTGYSFVNWSDGSTNATRTDVGVGANKSVTANFELNTYSVKYVVAIPGQGSISGSSVQNVTHGNSSVAVQAVAMEGYRFTGWSDGSTVNPRSDIGVSGEITVTANFEPNVYTLKYSASAYGSVMGSKSQSVSYGGNGSSIFAIPSSGYAFLRWSDGSTQNPRLDSSVSKDIAVYAIFGKVVAPASGNLQEEEEEEEVIVPEVPVVEEEKIVEEVVLRVVIDGEPVANAIIIVPDTGEEMVTDENGYVTVSKVNTEGQKVQVKKDGVVYEGEFSILGVGDESVQLELNDNHIVEEERSRVWILVAITVSLFGGVGVYRLLKREE